MWMVLEVMGMDNDNLYCRPDWRDKNAYPDIKKTSNKQWAWEFLRRNLVYQEMYKDKIATQKDHFYAAWGKGNVKLFKDKFRINHAMNPSVSPAPSGLSFLSKLYGHLMMMYQKSLRV